MFDLTIIDIMKTNAWQDHAGGPISRDYQCMFPAFHRANSLFKTDQVVNIVKAMLSRTFRVIWTVTTLEQYNNINLSATDAGDTYVITVFVQGVFRAKPIR